MTFFIDKELEAVSAEVVARAERGESSSKELACLVECWQAYIDKLEALEDKILTDGLEWNDTVTVEIDGRKIKFQNIDQVAEWMTNGHQ